ncbi:MAG: hypothetical protein ACRBM6_36865 [Geminicoccales bacterium]
MTGDGLELWRTDFDHQLPIGQKRWRRVLDLLGSNADTKKLAGTATVCDAVRLLDDNLANGHRITLQKTRWQFTLGDTSLDAAEITLDGRQFVSIAVESKFSARVRSMLESLEITRLGSPQNYTQFVDKMRKPAFDIR